jgi:predicted metalloprotease with PDZ domain
VIDSAVFINVTNGKIAEVAQAPAVGLEDASVSTWIHPSDGTATIYYPKGSLAGLLLDIAIRDASDNRASLDQVMRALYTSTYKAGHGVTEAEWWAALARAAGGKSFDDFAARYVRGRQPFPWATIAPLGGLEFVADSTREIRIGVGTSFDGDRVVVTSVASGSAAEAAGVAAGDELVSVGGIQVRDAGFGPAFRAKYAGKTGTQYPIVVRRGGQEQTLNAEVREAVQVSSRLEIDPKASPKAARIRAGLFRGTIDR